MRAPPSERPGRAGAASPPSLPPVVALGASLGGIPALRTVLGGLPAEFGAAVLVVQHLAPGSPPLAPVLAGATPLRVKQALQGERVEAGTVYVATANRHLCLDARGRISLNDDPRVRHARPSADVLFRSVAAYAGEPRVAVVLTGRLSDGTDGAGAVHAAGGTVLAQDRPTSREFGMPGSAIRSGVVDRVLPLDQIAPALIRWIRQGDE